MPAAVARVMSSLFKVVISCGLIAGCGTTPEDSVIPNTEQQAVSSPAITKAGSSTATVVNSLRGSGLVINGGTELGAYVLASYRAAGNAAQTTAEFTVTPAAGAAFQFALTGSGTRYSTRQLPIKREPGSTELIAVATTGYVECGNVPSGEPTQVSVMFDAASMTFDVLLDGASTPCTNLPTKMQPPVAGFNVMDPSNEGWGGRVEFSDLTVF